MAIISRDNNNKPILNAEYESMFPEGWEHQSLLQKRRLGSWWDPANYDYYYWDDKKKKLVQEFNDRALLPGEHFRWAKGTQVLPTSTTSTSTSATSGTASEAASPFTGLNLGTPKPTASQQTTSNYNLDWYKENRNKLEEYLKLGEQYNNAIKDQTLDHPSFLALQKFLNPDIYKGMDKDKNGDITTEEYTQYVNQDKNKFFNKFNVTDNSWLNDLGKQYYAFFNENNGLDKIRSYNDHLRMLYGNDLAENTGDDNSTAKLYFKNAPAYAADDRYKLARAYNEALQRGDYNTAKRLSLYMTDQGINHYGYHDHFDLNHQKGRWERTLSNGKKVGDFLDWIYEYSRNNNVSSEVLNNIVRNATKYNFDLTTRFWNNLGPEGATIRDAYAAAHQPTFKEGGQIFNMLFV